MAFLFNKQALVIKAEHPFESTSLIMITAGLGS
ncbi:hypothetical protein SAMN05216269_11671 [Flavobacterium xinjiangense]|uniref:Uncharacterized protein n=1 Tax=Flavobacterium xinjiangense TaxID=178356 RepID=A0A1M7PF53_9FLAO|nr:hypothetical protein SAMN05216269_11671 [Flavobacterium xinjiangense]